MPSLLSPIQVGPLHVRNRVFMAALTRNRSFPSSTPNKLNVEHFRQRAAGGVGLIVTDGLLVSPQGTEWPNAPGIWSEEQVNAWKPVIEAVHAEGSFLLAQLWHAGRAAHPDMPIQKRSGTPVYGPSAIAAKGGKFRLLPGVPEYVAPTAIDDPMKLVSLFKNGAINAKKAGFDGVEVHGANGYLVQQFLDSTSNARTDEWGGSVENRCRFPLEVLRALIEVWGADRVAIKINPGGGYNDMGMPLQETLDTYSHFVREANKLGLAYINLVRYNIAYDPTGRGTEHDVIASYGPLVTAPTLLVGNAGYTPEEAAEAVESGKMDAVSFGCLWVSNPDLVKRVEQEKDLNTQIDYKRLYGSNSGEEAEERKGYNDYPAVAA
ncbi:flavo protein NADH-dependent oxidoreductase [Fistulina hepatica ATCC 64428]|uniref:Flavo protein NADH-dependent oxidoreductase n=1 Tax=Fistulina hepatica ATCC 64428 TaxID=1128425 RepID=A0A0D7ABL4_9AGAR|nr:flavo protein NADH-dependent oxidoreductase [Fistulina hepatica ATCC 64428]